MIQFIRGNKLPVITLGLVLFMISNVGGQGKALSSPDEKPAGNLNAEPVIEVDGALHGIAFDNLGNMFVASNGNEIFKITPNGKAKRFCTVPESQGFGYQGTGGVYMFDMTFGPDDNLYVAAENRILSISRDGKVSTVIKEAFSGRWGACGIDFDDKGQLYVGYGNKVARYSAGFKKNIFIDGDTTGVKLTSVIGIQFDPEFKHLYVCDTYGKKVLRFPVDSGGAVGNPEVVYKTGIYQPEYVAVDARGHVFISNYDTGIMVKTGPAGIMKTVKFDNMIGNETVVFGGKGFDEQALYVTSWYSGKVFKVKF